MLSLGLVYFSTIHKHNTVYETVLYPSTGDVLLHCIVDAILGALTLPDIGKWVA